MAEDKKPAKKLGLKDIAKVAAETAKAKQLKKTPEREKTTVAERKKRVAQGIKERAAKKRKDIQKMGETIKPRIANPFPMTDSAKENMKMTDEMLEIKRKRARGEI